MKRKYVTNRKSGQLTPKGPTSTTFANFLLDEVYVAVTPGEGFLSIVIIGAMEEESAG